MSAVSKRISAIADGGYRLAGALLDPWYQGPEVGPGLWSEGVHAQGLLCAASAGEVRAASALRPGLEQRTGGPWWIASGTESGCAVGADFRSPQDFPSAVERFLDVLKPQCLVGIESEFWPNRMKVAEKRGLPIGVAGARISERSFRRFRRLGASFANWTAGISAFACADATDAERFEGLGVSSDRLAVCGWIKWPRRPSGEEVFRRSKEAEGLFQKEDRNLPLVVLGSLHPGELRAVKKSLLTTGWGPDRCRWLIALRHARTERILRKEGRGLPSGRVRFETRMGVLQSWYALADRVVVGGGHSGKGLHNVLEPLILGRVPSAFLRRPDPGGLGARLKDLGLMVDLDAPRIGPKSGDRQAFRVDEETLAPVLRSLDGRNSCLDFLATKGVTPVRSRTSK